MHVIHCIKLCSLLVVLRSLYGVVMLTMGSDEGPSFYKLDCTYQSKLVVYFYPQ